MSGMEAVVQIEHLKKKFGKKVAIPDLTMEVYAGEVFGFLGPNGAGKTTTIKILTGLLQSDEGNVKICGYDLEKEFEKALTRVGAIVENPELYSYMSGWSNLKMFARMRKGITEERLKEIVELVGLSNRIHEKVKKYSLGMRQRLGLAVTLMADPEVLILDEPTNGLDPAGIKHLRDILKELAHRKNVCVIVSSHLMSEMELMCDRVGILSEGKLIQVQKIGAILETAQEEKIIYCYHVKESSKVVSWLEKNYTLNAEKKDEEHFELSIDNTDQLIEINKNIILNGFSILTVCPKEKVSLEDVFLEMTEKGGDSIASLNEE